MDFDSHTSQTVDAAVGIVNALTPGCERGRPLDGLTDRDRQARLRAVLTTRASRRRRTGPTPEETRRLGAFADQLRVVFVCAGEGDLDGAAGALNALLRDTRPRPMLTCHDGEQWHLHYHGEFGDRVMSWATSSAVAIAVVLGSEARDRLGICSASACDRVYVDLSRNGSRRFCSTNCQNRTKTAAFRARRRDGAVDAEEAR